MTFTGVNFVVYLVWNDVRNTATSAIFRMLYGYLCKDKWKWCNCPSCI